MRLIGSSVSGDICGGNKVCSHKEGNTEQGLCDMASSVSEYVEDCWHENYVGAPSNGKPWKTKCHKKKHTVRGGNYMFLIAEPENFRVDFRFGIEPHKPNWDETGFRCVRDTKP